MKFMVTGTMRYQATPTEMDAETERLDRVVKAWSPADPNRTVHAFVMGIDGHTNWMIVETDDVNGLMRDMAVFSPWLEQHVVPVLDITDAGAALERANALRRSALE
jgi:hypothetical protein